MCDDHGQPASVTDALGMLERALDHLNAADAASLPATVQAQVLRVLERAEGKHTAARARVLGAFAGQAAYEDDGGLHYQRTSATVPFSVCITTPSLVGTRPSTALPSLA